MNFKPSKAKIVLSAIVGLLGLFGEYVGMHIGGPPSILIQIIAYLFSLLVPGGFIYLILSLTDKKK